MDALERAIGLVEATAERHGIEHAVQTSIGVTDGERLWALRYSTERKSRSLFVSTDAESIRELHPDNPRLQRLRDEDRVVVSEPISDLPGCGRRSPSRPSSWSSRARTSNASIAFEPAQPALS